MRLLFGEYGRPISILLAVLQIAGCGDSGRLYEQVRTSREIAYRQWKSRKQQREESEVRITGSLSVDDCLKLALANNKVLQGVVQEKEIARGEQLKSYSAILPNVGLTGNYRRLDEVSSFSIAGKKITLGDLNNYSAALGVTQPIYAGGSIAARLHAARLFSLLTDQTVRAAVQELVYACTHSYYDVLISQHLSRISADAVRSAKAHLDDVKQKRQGGVASDFDVLRAEVELSNFQAELIRNKNAINMANATLVKVMGVSQHSDFVLSDALVYVRSETTEDQAVEAAYQNRPGLFSREFGIKYQRQLLKIAKSRYLPVISGYFNFTRSRPDPHNQMIIDWGGAWDAGLMLTLPLFEGFAREGEVVIQKARLRQAQIDLIDAEQTALFEITRALLAIQNAEEFVDSQKLNLTRAEEGLRLAEVGYREGANTQVEMIDAQAALTTARANYYQAIYSHSVAKLDLQKAMGTIAAFEHAWSDSHLPGDGAASPQETSLAASAEQNQEPTE
ncbi:MAG: TolC family protein [Phycisphaerales bacterium]|nr:MAG: TolC family protein [Phycisphaerales bacterium]